MTKNFDICFVVEPMSAEARRQILTGGSLKLLRLLSQPTWLMSVDAAGDMLESTWDGAPVDVPPMGTVSLYPVARSSVKGAIVIALFEGREYWTVAVPELWARLNEDVVMDFMLDMRVTFMPCIAGEEYSMIGVASAGGNILEDLTSTETLASIAVVMSEEVPDGWIVIRTQGGSSLIRRESASSG